MFQIFLKYFLLVNVRPREHKECKASFAVSPFQLRVQESFRSTTKRALVLTAFVVSPNNSSERWF